jgi:Flp pilus assembly protein TadD/4-amino-4-deoxy-L-arabinose transferase-like glycosyltransferase
MNDAAPNKVPFLDRFDRALESSSRWLYVLFAAAFLLKLLYVIQSAGSLHVNVPIMDSKYYDKEAREIVRGGFIRPEAYFMGPLYPYVLSLIYTIFGRDFLIVRLIQIAGGAFVTVLTYLLGKEIFRPSAAFAGVVLLVFYGAMTFHEAEMLMEWLGVLINMSALVVLHRMANRTGYRKYAIAGFLVGLSALARANVLLFLPVLLVWTLCFVRENKRVRKALLAAAAAAVAIAPATLHNYVASRDFVLITSNGGVNFYIGNGEEATGIFYPAKDITFETESSSRSYVERLFGRDMKPSEISAYWFGRAFDFIEKHPGKEIKLLLRKTAIFFNGYEVPQIESWDIVRAKYSSLRLLFVNFWWVLALGLFGMIFSLREWRRHFLLYGFVFAYAFSIILFFVTSRYRIQIAPVMCLFAGYALVSVLPRVLRRLRPAVGAAALFVLILTVTRPGLFALPERDLEWREHIHEARRLGEAGRYGDAVSEIDKAIAIHPEVAESYLQRAEIHKGGRNYFKAVEDYSRALKIAPDMSGARYDFAQTLRRLKMYGPAIEEYEKAIELEPVKAEAYNNLGITYTEMGDRDKAIEYFRKVIALDETYIKAYSNLGAALAQQGEFEEAIDVLERAKKVNPKYPLSYKNLAMVYIELKRPREAYENLSRYHDLEPRDPSALETLAKLRIAIAADSTK